MKTLSAITRVRPLTERTGALFLIHAGVTVAAAATLGPSAFISYSGAALIVVLDLCAWLSLRTADRRAAPLVLMSAWFLVLFALPRLSAFQIFPAQNIGFAALEPFAPDEIAYGLAYIIAGYLVLWAGFWAGSRLQAPAERPTEPQQMPVAGIAAFALMAFAADIYVRFILGVSIFSPDPSKWGSRMGWISLVLSLDVVLLAAVVWLVIHPHASRRDRVIMVGIVFAWVAYNLLMGSRGGPFRVMLFIGYAAVALRGNPLVSWARVAAIVFLSFAASAALYPIGSAIRFLPASGEQTAEAVVNDWFRPGLVGEQDNASTLRQAWAQSASVVRVAAALSPIVTRLGMVDYPIAIITREPRTEVVERYLTLSYGLKNFANNMVPGELFPDHDIMTSRVFTMAYRGYDEQHVRTAFLSEPWTIWGFAWLKGGPIWGFAIIFALAAVVQAGYVVALRISGPMLAPYVGATYLFVPVTSGLIQLWGIDHALTIAAHFSIALLAFFGVVFGLRGVLQVAAPAFQTKKQSRPAASANRGDCP